MRTYLKNNIPPLLAGLLLRLGFKPKSLLILKRWAEESLVGSFRALRKQKPATHPHPQRIIFFTVLGSHSFMIGSELALARALRARGHEVHVVLCDGILPACENHSVGLSESEWKYRCEKCALRGQGLTTAAGIQTHYLSQLEQSAKDPEADAILKNQNFSYIIESALYKYFRIGKLEGSLTEREQAQKIESACNITARAAIACTRLRPDRVIMSHGVYSSWAPALMIFQSLGIPTMVYNGGKKKNTAVANWVKGLMDWDVSAEWEKVKDQPLSPAQDQAIKAYLDGRVTHKADALKYNFGEPEERKKTLQRFNLDENKPIIVLFTNVLWDAASAQKEIAFPNAVDWVMQTIQWFADHPEKQLVVKIHPAEVVIGTNQPFVKEIERVFPKLPPNVRVIAPEEKVNSWSITQITSLGLVHTSTPGMELPLSGVPCLVASGVHYRGKGFTVDIESREQYFQILNDFPRINFDAEKAKTLALRYAYLLFERYHLDWSFMIEGDYGRYVAVNARSDEELNQNATIQLLCEKIEKVEPPLRAH